MLLHAVRTRRVRSPEVIKRLKQHEVLRQRGLQRRDGDIVVLRRWHRDAVVPAGRRPAAFRHDGGLSSRLGGDLVDPALDERAGIGGGDGGEEGVAVEGAVVRGGAEFDVVVHDAFGVDGDDGALVAGCAEHGADCGYGGDDLRDGRCCVLDGLVEDTDSVDVLPVSVDLSDELFGVALHVAYVEDAGEDLHGFVLDGGHYVFCLVAVDAIESDDLVVG